MNNFFKKVDLFDLKKSKKIQKLKLEKKKINVKKKYPPEIFNKLINLLKKNIKKTNNITKEMIGESINLKNIDNKNNNEDIEMIDMKQLEKLRNSEKIPKIGSAGQINMVNRAYSNLMDFGDDYLKLDDIDFYKRKNEIMKKYQNIRINAEVEEKPEESDKRYKILNRNNFIIKKKLDALIRETVKFIDSPIISFVILFVFLIFFFNKVINLLNISGGYFFFIFILFFSNLIFWIFFDFSKSNKSTFLKKLFIVFCLRFFLILKKSVCVLNFELILLSSPFKLCSFIVEKPFLFCE
jgi:hypothetical protein